MLTVRLRARLPEIEAALLARMTVIADPGEVTDASYAHGLRGAVAAGLRYGLEALESGPMETLPPLPPQLLAQARLAVRSRVGLDTVLRRYCAAHTMLEDYLIGEADPGERGGEELKAALRIEATVYDHLVTEISKEYMEALASRGRTSAQHRAELARRLLVGRPLDVRELDYRLDAWHVGVVAAGPGAAAGLRDLAAALDRELLLAEPEPEIAWAWLGGAPRASAEAVVEAAATRWRPSCALAIGEPGHGVAGWRLSHRQALAALPIAKGVSEPPIRYIDVALLASILQDDLLSESLTRLYLEPLSREPDGGEAARRTLRAYFAAEGNVTSAAAALKVDRRTIKNRLRRVEKRLGILLRTAATEIDMALHMDQFVNADLGHSESDFSPHRTFVRRPCPVSVGSGT